MQRAGLGPSDPCNPEGGCLLMAPCTDSNWTVLYFGGAWGEDGVIVFFLISIYFPF